MHRCGCWACHKLTGRSSRSVWVCSHGRASAHHTATHLFRHRIPGREVPADRRSGGTPARCRGYDVARDVPLPLGLVANDPDGDLYSSTVDCGRLLVTRRPAPGTEERPTAGTSSAWVLVSEPHGSRQAYSRLVRMGLPCGSWTTGRPQCRHGPGRGFTAVPPSARAASARAASARARATRRRP